MLRIIRLIKFVYSESAVSYDYEFVFATSVPKIVGGGILCIDKKLEMKNVRMHLYFWLVNLCEQKEGRGLSEEEYTILFDACRCAVPEGSE